MVDEHQTEEPSAVVGFDYTDLTCGACLHYREPAQGASTGSCWLEPPVPVSIPVQQPPPGIAVPKNAATPQGQGIMTFPTRPPVNHDTGACGQFEPGALPILHRTLAPDTPLDA